MLSLCLRLVVSSLALSGASRQLSHRESRFQNDPPDEPPKPSESVDEPPQELFTNPKHPRLKAFLSKML